MTFSISKLIPFADTVPDVLSDKSGRLACDWLKKAYIANNAAGFCEVSEQTDLSHMCRELSALKLRLEIKSDIENILCLAIHSDRNNEGQYVDTAWAHVMAFPERIDSLRFNLGNCMTKVSPQSIDGHLHRIGFSMLMERKGLYGGGNHAQAMLEAVQKSGFDEHSLNSLRHLIEIGGNEIHTKIRAKYHQIVTSGAIKFSPISKGHFELLNILMPTQAMILQFACDLFQKQLGNLCGLADLKGYQSPMSRFPRLTDEAEIDAVIDLIELTSTCFNESAVLYVFNTVMNRELGPTRDSARSAECASYLSTRLKKIFDRMDGISSIWRLALLAHLSPATFNDESKSMEALEYDSCLAGLGLALSQTKESSHLKRLVCHLLISEYDYKTVIATFKITGNSLGELYKLSGDRNLIPEMNHSQRRVAINSDLGL